MGFPLTRALVLLLLPAALVGQEPPATKSGAVDVDAPLPAGAIMRLGETRFRPGARIKQLAFSPDGTRLASWGNWLYFEDRLSVWDTATGRELFTRSMPESQLADLGWGTNGGLSVMMAEDTFRVWAFADAAGKYTGSEVVAKVNDGRRAPRPVREGRVYQTFAVSDVGNRLVAFRGRQGTAPASVELFEAKEAASPKDLKQIATRQLDGVETCSGLRFIRGGKSVVVLSDKAGEQAAVIWDTEKNTVSDPVTIPIGVRQGMREATDLMEDGSAVAVGLADGSIKIIELPTGKERLSVKKHAAKWPEVCAVKFVNGGKNVLSAGRDNKQLVWDAKTGVDVSALNGHDSWVEAVAISPDGKRVATAGQDSLIRLWDAATWKPIVPPKGAHHTIWRLEVSRDGKYAVSGGGGGAHVWEIASGREVRSVPSDHRGGYVLFAPDGDLLVGDADGKLSLYPIPTGAAKPLAAKGRMLDFSPDGKTLLIGEGTSVLIWDWPACTKRSAMLLTGEVQSGVISPDSRVAVVGISDKRVTAVIDLKSGVSREMPFNLHWFSRVAGFAPGGQVVCGTAGTAEAEAWNINNLSSVRKFQKPPQRGNSHFYQLGFAVSPDGHRAASCQNDGGVAVYETATGHLLAHFTGHRDSLIALAWTPDGNRVLSAGGDHQVLVWDTSLHMLAGKVSPTPADNRIKIWGELGHLPAKEAIKTTAGLVASPDGLVDFFAERLKPVPVADAAVLDRIFRDLDDKAFAVREKASRELATLGPGAVAGVQERKAKSSSEEVRGRADAFLKQFEIADVTPERLRFLRALEVLAAVDAPSARTLIEGLAAGAANVWETEAAKQMLLGMPARGTRK
ncbi:MAG TPA: WD40 repeat domain-containing protein [Gemmataceae bacterium]|jgi:WD40 repeat protein|nr:WD40 repeat domain-containing protein [Gemmataceae bacterium]